MTIWLMRLAYWILKATNTHSEYVTLTALPLKQSLHERGSVLHYIYIACLVVNENWCLMIFLGEVERCVYTKQVVYNKGQLRLLSTVLLFPINMDTTVCHWMKNATALYYSTILTCTNE
jgi:hypothetical protein